MKFLIFKEFTSRIIERMSIGYLATSLFTKQAIVKTNFIL